MNQIIFSFITSLLITVLTTPLAIRFAKRFNLLDDPKTRSHPGRTQNRVVPRAGGLPLFFAIAISILLFVPLNQNIFGILFGILLLLTVGLLDDILKDFSPYPRLALQLIAALIVVISGIGITYITNPLGGIINLDNLNFTFNFLNQNYTILIADAFAILWIVWMMNMINWSKGVDGQMPGIVLVAALTIGFVSYRFYSAGDPEQLPIVMLSGITAGASLGLLIFNWHPAKIFPGFSGSMILGFMLAVLSIFSDAKLATALLVLLIPSIDFFYTFSRRILSKKSPFLGDSRHLHHLLLKRGLTHTQISCLYIATCAILSLLATTLSSQGKFFAFLLIGVLVAGSILWLHLFHQEEKEND